MFPVLAVWPILVWSLSDATYTYAQGNYPQVPRRVYLCPLWQEDWYLVEKRKRQQILPQVFYFTMKTTRGLVLKLTKHAKIQARDKGFSVSQILEMWENPEEIYPVRAYPGQWRVCGNGICLVVVPKRTSCIGITCYVNRDLTPPREDQLSTRAGKRYAKRYAQGKGRG
jgi:hypothetical protein